MQHFTIEASGPAGLGRRLGAMLYDSLLIFALIMVGVLTSEGVGKILDADTDMLDEMSQYLLPLLMERATKGMLHAQAESA